MLILVKYFEVVNLQKTDQYFYYGISHITVYKEKTFQRFQRIVYLQ